jgi:tRNA-dihydrouridine synthase
MIARATYGRPWIFKEIKHYLTTGQLMPPLTLQEKADLAKTHLLKSIEIKGMPRGVFEMRRHLTNYFKSLSHFKETRLKLVTSLDVEELLQIIEWIPRNWKEEG